MSILSELSEEFGAAFVALGLDASDGEVAVSQRPELAQYQCNGALGAAKRAGRNPRELAEAVIAGLPDSSRFSDLSVAGPGFINITLADEVLASYVETIRTGDGVGVMPREAPARMIIDYGGPNVAKELHVGHLRPAVIGESLKRIMRALGNEVIGDVHLGDWGSPQGQLIAELEDRQPDLPYFDAANVGPYPVEPPVAMDDFNEMYPTASNRAATDEEFKERARQATAELQKRRPGYLALWQHFRDVSIDAIKAVYDELGVSFDLWHGESTIAELLDPLIERVLASGVARISEGAVVIDVALPDDKNEIPPLLMAKSDGATLYTTWDVATIQDRVDQFDVAAMIYIVDARQSLHFEQVFRAARRAGIVGEDVLLEHAGNGTVNGADGKPLKTRDGGTPLLRSLIDDAIDRAAQRLAENDLASEYSEEERSEIAHLVGLAALKYGDLQNHRASDYIFDLDRFVSFEGRTGPYLLYSAVRMKSILRKASEQGLTPGVLAPATGEFDRNLMLALLRLPEIVSRAAEHRAPNHIALYAYELAAEFSRFYEHCRILDESDGSTQASWLGLVELCLRQVTFLLDLLVMEVPERM
ncbi:MAG: arginine--tRNA ligase [bacterium]|nr:arginine--tRNA ligase [bacterium]